jgi:hypothetical protein
MTDQLLIELQVYPFEEMNLMIDTRITVVTSNANQHDEIRPDIV